MVLCPDTLHSSVVLFAAPGAFLYVNVRLVHLTSALAWESQQHFVAINGSADISDEQAQT